MPNCSAEPPVPVPAVRAALLVHGAGGGGWEWNVWRRVLDAAGVHTCATDLRPAAAGLEHTHLRDYAAQVASALQALPRPRAVVGASLGGLLAALNADAADVLVLVDPLPPAPWHRDLPAREWPARVAWARDARLASTRRALAGADAASALYAFRRWRDESGAAMREATAGIDVPAPACPVLCMISMQDEDVPPAVSEALAAAWRASVLRCAGGHAAPLFGPDAAALAGQASAWMTRLP